MSDVSSIMEAHGLSFSSSPVESNPFMPQESEDLRHFLCTLSGGSLSSFEFYVSLGPDIHGETPDAAFALSLLLDDVRAYRECSGYGDFARMLGIDEDDRSAELAFAEIERLAPYAEALSEFGAAPAQPSA